ncbi:MAG: hypothetical protein JWO22_3514 [Frankiales bacterium]|nr:hypothetical protein [Frankiales bacterium]
MAFSLEGVRAGTVVRPLEAAQLGGGHPGDLVQMGRTTVAECKE